MPVTHRQGSSGSWGAEEVNATAAAAALIMIIISDWLTVFLAPHNHNQKVNALRRERARRVFLYVVWMYLNKGIPLWDPFEEGADDGDFDRWWLRIAQGWQRYLLYGHFMGLKSLLFELLFWSSWGSNTGTSKIFFLVDVSYGMKKELKRRGKVKLYAVLRRLNW